MGRVFEKRKHKMFKRYAKMAKAFTRIGREIVIAVKAGGPDVDSNSRLRMVVQNARSINMPKENIDNAIKRAVSKDQSNYEEVVYEGYGPHGVPMLVECATDNPTRTVANVRMYFNRNNGALGTSGSVSFMFEKKSLFTINAEGLDKDETEMTLIDFGAEEYTWDEETKQLIVQTSFSDFGNMAKGLEDNKFTVISTDRIQIPATYNGDLSDEQEEEIQALVDKMEEDDDVIAVYHNLG